MVTDVDHQTILAKLVVVLQGNSDIFETPPEDSNKFRTISVGMPDFNEIFELPMPSCYVVHDESEVDRDEQEGPTSSGVELASKVSFTYLIIFVAQGKDSKTVEAKLDTFEKEIKETLKSNKKLGDVGAVTTNTVVHNSRIVSTTHLNPVLLGHEQQGRVIKLNLIKHIT